MFWTMNPLRLSTSDWFYTSVITMLSFTVSSWWLQPICTIGRKNCLGGASHRLNSNLRHSDNRCIVLPFLYRVCWLCKKIKKPTWVCGCTLAVRWARTVKWSRSVIWPWVLAARQAQRPPSAISVRRIPKASWALLYLPEPSPSLISRSTPVEVSRYHLEITHVLIINQDGVYGLMEASAA